LRATKESLKISYASFCSPFLNIVITFHIISDNVLSVWLAPCGRGRQLVCRDRLLLNFDQNLKSAAVCCKLYLVAASFLSILFLNAHRQMR
jgi:hypothetical protein